MKRIWSVNGKNTLGNATYWDLPVSRSSVYHTGSHGSMFNWNVCMWYFEVQTMNCLNCPFGVYFNEMTHGWDCGYDGHEVISRSQNALKNTMYAEPIDIKCRRKE